MFEFHRWNINCMSPVIYFVSTGNIVEQVSRWLLKVLWNKHNFLNHHLEWRVYKLNPWFNFSYKVSLMIPLIAKQTEYWKHYWIDWILNGLKTSIWTTWLIEFLKEWTEFLCLSFDDHVVIQIYKQNTKTSGLIVGTFSTGH